MLTQAEVKKIIDQINESFKEDRKRLEALEAQVAALTAKPAAKSTAKATKEAE